MKKMTNLIEPLPVATASVRITIPAELLTHFEAQAFLVGSDVETYIAQHLSLTRDLTDGEAAIYLRAAEAVEVRRLLGGRVTTSQRLIDMIGRLARIKVAGRAIDVSPERQEAMVWWAKSMQLSLDDALPKLFDQALGMLLKC